VPDKLPHSRLRVLRPHQMLTHQKPVISGCAQAVEIPATMDPAFGNPDPVGRQLGRDRLHPVESHLEGGEVARVDPNDRRPRGHRGCRILVSKDFEQDLELELGGRLQQNLRCASASYRIDAKADLEVVSDRVRGHWEERTNAASGSVTGRMTGSGFNLSIRGESFTAAMAVSTSSCKQSINIAPEGTDVRRIAIGLGKC